jgi:hypothetical protein
LITGKVLVELVSAHWGKRFNALPERFEQPGSLILPDESFQDTGSVNIYHVGMCAFVRMDPAICAQLQLHPRQELPSILTLPELRDIVGLGMRHTARVNLVGIGSYFYLDPQNFKAAASPHPATLLQLDPHTDAGLIAGLCRSCPPTDVEDAEISTNEPDAVIFGFLLDGKLISYAGFRYWDEIFADIGVLTRPDHRRQRLALSATSRLCEWLIQYDLIPMYRVLNTNISSRKIPEALGFSRMVEIEVLKVLE